MLCHEFFFLLPRQFLKVSANVIQFKAFNVSSMGHATFSTFVLGLGKAEIWWTLFISNLHSWQIAIAFFPLFVDYILQSLLIFVSLMYVTCACLHICRIILCGTFWGHKSFVLLLKLQGVFRIPFFSKYVCNYFWTDYWTITIQ